MLSNGSREHFLCAGAEHESRKLAQDPENARPQLSGRTPSRPSLRHQQAEPADESPPGLIVPLWGNPTVGIAGRFFWSPLAAGAANHLQRVADKLPRLY